MAKKKVKKLPRFIPITALAILSGGLLWFSATQRSPISVPVYEATQVFDGDTFETKEKQYIRLSGIDAPETGRCGSQQAKNELERLILGKKLYIKILYHIGSRMTGLVYSDQGSVNEAMLASGWARKYDRDAPNDPAMQKATDAARDKRKGVYSPLCTQTENTSRPSCNIKGNIVNDEKKYHMPGCPSYFVTSVQLDTGDQWFCTEQEAQNAGFTKAGGCK